MAGAEAPRLSFAEGATLVGGGALDRADLDAARARAPTVVAADGGANRLRAWGLGADAVIGDMDSVEDLAGWEASGATVLRIAEQETTDLEKCLYAVAAPVYLGVGFLGRRFDHTLAALHALLRFADKRIALIGEEDVVFLAPARWRAALAPGARVSFFPLRPVRGLASEGLRWPVNGLAFAPGERIGSSNIAESGEVAARFDRPGMAAMVERRFLDAALDSLAGDRS
jgi:thiamine pyrophosphokinase